MVFVFLFLTSLSMIISSCIHVAANDIISFFYGWVVFRCIYVPRLLYPFICQWAFRLFACLGYCEQCCYEHSGKCIFLNYSFVLIYAQEWDHMVILFLVFWGTSILFSTLAAPIYIPTNSVGGFSFSTPSPAFLICRLFNDCHSDWCQVVPHCSFDLHFSNS